MEAGKIRKRSPSSEKEDGLKRRRVGDKNGEKEDQGHPPRKIK